MNEYRIVYCKIPTNHNEDRVMFVEAETPEHALEKAKQQLERRGGRSAGDYVWGKPTITA